MQNGCIIMKSRRNWCIVFAVTSVQKILVHVQEHILYIMRIFGKRSFLVMKKYL